MLPAAAEDARGALADHDRRTAGAASKGFRSVPWIMRAPTAGQVAAAHRAQRRRTGCAHLRQRPSLRHECADGDLFADHHAVTREAGGHDVGHRPQPRSMRFDRLGLSRDRVVGREHELKRQRVRRVVAAVDREQPAEAVDQQAGADEQHGRHHELSDHQRRAQA